MPTVMPPPRTSRQASSARISSMFHNGGPSGVGALPRVVGVVTGRGRIRWSSSTLSTSERRDSHSRTSGPASTRMALTNYGGSPARPVQFGSQWGCVRSAWSTSLRLVCSSVPRSAMASNPQRSAFADPRRQPLAVEPPVPTGRTPRRAATRTVMVARQHPRGARHRAAAPDPTTPTVRAGQLPARCR